jgi:hypothetical protein
MELPINIDTDTTTGNLKIVDAAGYLTVTICANSISRSKTLGVKTENALDENLESYIETAKKLEKDLYNGCFDGPPSIEVSVLAKEIAKYCTTGTKNSIKAEIMKGRNQETTDILVGF